MFDPNLIRYITEYLKLCNNCKRYEFYNNKATCCICHKFYCSKCEYELYNLYGFGQSKYCYDCYDYFIIFK